VDWLWFGNWHLQLRRLPIEPLLLSNGVSVCGKMMMMMMEEVVVVVVMVMVMGSSIVID
jgi:hypothetical protein